MADMKSLSREEIRRIDRCAIETLGIPGVILMENAGRNAAAAIQGYLEKASCKTVAVVAGAGNNGGDGYVIARHLANWGAKVTTFLVVPAEKVAGDAKINLDVIRGLGHDIRDATGQALASLGETLKAFELVVDAVGGTGIRGPLRGAAAEAVEQINASGRPVVAVDIPTGLDCDSGLADGPAVKAVMTVTFVARKIGFDNPASRQYTGQVKVADIGIPADRVAQIAAETT